MHQTACPCPIEQAGLGIGVVGAEGFGLGAARGFDHQEASGHRLAVVADRRSGHDDLDRLGLEIIDMGRPFVGPDAARAGLVDAVDEIEHGVKSP